MQSSANICPWHIVLPEKCVSVVIYANLKKEREKASKHYANAEKFEHQSTYAMSYRTMLLLLFVYRDIYFLWRIDKDIDFLSINKSWNFFIRIKIYRLKKKGKKYCQIQCLEQLTRKSLTQCTTVICMENTLTIFVSYPRFIRFESIA